MSNDLRAEEAAVPPLVGAAISDIREMTAAEREADGWEEDTNPTCIVLDNGVVIYPSRDGEGNGPGVLFGRHGDVSFYLTPDPDPPEEPAEELPAADA